MEPLSAAASVIAVVQIADRIIGLCKAYITGVNDAPADLRAILIEVGSVKCVLEVIELLGSPCKTELVSHSVAILEKLRSPLEGCKEALESLEALFPSQSQSPVKGKRQRLALSLATLAWPFKREKALKLLEEIGRHKSTMSLGLATEACQDLKNIRRDVENIRAMTSENEMNQVLDWLVTTNPSSNHNNACQLHEEHTGQWLTNSPEYAKWKSGQSRFLWLHGIPGAGKTVLLSYIAKDVNNFCRESEGLASAYYYCYFAHNQDETTHFLRWVVSQLCRKIGGVPQEVRKMFRKGVHPTASELLEVLGAVTENFLRVYITIDALDEFANRENILNLFYKIFANQKIARIHLLATSRKEVDIERALLPVAQELSLSNPYVDEDIRTYVKSRLRDDPKFNRWPDSLRHETESALVKGAKGMFRWAFCQLDILKRLNSAQEIRLALTQLPKSLDETYERILCSILAENQRMAHTTLNLIACNDDIGLEALSDLLAVDLENPSFDRNNQPLDPYAPVEACTCLLTYDKVHDTLHLAHYTVKEFLISSRVGNGPARFFQMTDDSIHCVTASCFIIYMLYKNYDDESGPAMPLAARAWDVSIRRIESERNRGSLSALVIQLLDPNQPHFQKWTLEMHRNPLDEFPIWSVEPTAEYCVTLAYLCWYGFVEAAKLFLDMRTEPFPFGNLLEWINHPGLLELVDQTEEIDCLEDVKKPLLDYLQGNDTGLEILTLLQLPVLSQFLDLNRTEHFLELMVSKGAEIDTCSPTGYYLLTTALNRRFPSNLGDPAGFSYEGDTQPFINFLLAHGAKIDFTRCTSTSIKEAVKELIKVVSLRSKDFWGCCWVVRILLDNGAAVNAVANDEVNMQRIRHTCHLFFQHLTVPALLEKEHEYTEWALQHRGNGSFYDTPLRMLEDDKEEASMRELTSYELANYKTLEDLLKSYGAKSLHLFPVQGLPGYVEEDMEEWDKFNALQPATASSSSTSGHPLKQGSIQAGS